MSKVQFMKSSVPNAVQTAYAEKGMLFDANYVDILMYTTFAAVGDLLRTIKTLDQPTAFVIRDEANNIIVGAIVKYIPSTDKEHPEGNWSYVWSFDPADFEGDDINITDLNNPADHIYFVKRAGDKYGMEYLAGNLVPMHVMLMKCLKDWLVTNASDKEECEIELENIFSARSAIEDGEVVLSIEPLGKFVQLIKDDADLVV